MKKKILGLLLCGSTFFTALSLTSCSPKSYDMSNVSFDNLEVVYDGSAHSLAIEGTLPEGVTVTYSGNEQVNVESATLVIFRCMEYFSKIKIPACQSSQIQ